MQGETIINISFFFFFLSSLTFKEVMYLWLLLKYRIVAEYVI